MESLMTKTIFKTLLAVAALAFFVVPAHADQLFICQSCSTAPGGDPNIITNTSSFNVGVAGGAAQQNPLLIVVAVYDGNGTPSISFGATPSEPAATVGTYGLTANTGTLTSGDAFAALGLSSGGSESFVNFSGADTANGFAAPTSFSLYAFQVPTALGATAITIDESGASQGSFILAYDCKAGTGSTTSACATQGDVSQTVFTNTGFVDNTPGVPTPEPSSLGLLGLGVLGLVAFKVRRPLANLI